MSESPENRVNPESKPNTKVPVLKEVRITAPLDDEPTIVDDSLENRNEMIANMEGSRGGNPDNLGIKGSKEAEADLKGITDEDIEKLANEIIPDIERAKKKVIESAQREAAERYPELRLKMSQAEFTQQVVDMAIDLFEKKLKREQP